MRILAGGRVLFIGQHQCPEFDYSQDALPGNLKVLLCLVDGAERRRQIQAKLNVLHSRAHGGAPEAAEEVRMLARKWETYRRFCR